MIVSYVYGMAISLKSQVHRKVKKGESDTAQVSQNDTNVIEPCLTGQKK